MRETTVPALALGIRSRYPWAMIPHFLSIAMILFVTVPANSANAPQPTKKPIAEKKTVRTWKAVADYILKNGTANSIKAPMSRTLGYDSDEIPAKTLRIKSAESKDKKEHAIRVTYIVNEKGAVIPIDLLLGITLVEVIPEGRKIDGFGIRITPDGRIVSAMRATGIVGEVEQKALSVDSAEVQRVYNAESILHLKTINLEHLTQ